MRLMVNHQTHYSYSDLVFNSIQYIKMLPFDNVHQNIISWDISVPGEKQIKRDAFNNLWMTSSQRFAYQQMTIMAQGIVELNSRTENGLSDQMTPYLFLQPTPATMCNAEMKEFAHRYVPIIHRENLMNLAAAILEYMPYAPQTTNVNTSAIEAFQSGQGVCQDHSHVFIAMCKSLGVPARYVSGYLYVPDMSHLASHAWVEVFLNEMWYCFDISNQLFKPSSHIYVAIGRDYWDVAPIRGVREQGGLETMQTIVQVLAC